jgi:hypothetical protein
LLFTSSEWTLVLHVKVLFVRVSWVDPPPLTHAAGPTYLLLSTQK